ncbi:hypothetical protein SARC_05361 [Sphaeroforma arctica JP610]|uniref:Mitochondrial fission process protein 1 n=1 Tax=Sphaeroforma arctica JP610 TaxID=667725 RepID=A0A0L0G0H7_9EUKA|nr:hypothetical protein SARC_05361 [Sphaeroforma arctica JP610]KNC82346.1 hypothetical protein SARC_05361 [Sphaeroforma arctica JP610]|eukprot:XP_014156248.1 hypothetical protein SARC_05361 [Sphaeroforma arctica JP610]
MTSRIPCRKAVPATLDFWVELVGMHSLWTLRPFAKPAAQSAKVSAGVAKSVKYGTKITQNANIGTKVVNTAATGAKVAQTAKIGAVAAKTARTGKLVQTAARAAQNARSGAKLAKTAKNVAPIARSGGKTMKAVNSLTSTAKLTKGAKSLAMSGDVGTAIKPVVSPFIVKALYGVTYAYVSIDVLYSGYAVRQAGGEARDAARAMAQTMCFQGLASFALPGVIVHTQIHFAEKMFATVKSLKPYRKYGPTVAGLACIPLLPTLVDTPAEYLVATVFDVVWPSAFADSQA